MLTEISTRPALKSRRHDHPYRHPKGPREGSEPGEFGPNDRSNPLTNRSISITVVHSPWGVNVPEIRHEKGPAKWPVGLADQTATGLTERMAAGLAGQVRSIAVMMHGLAMSGVRDDERGG
jgi:hypothetical protein